MINSFRFCLVCLCVCLSFFAKAQNDSLFSDSTLEYNFVQMYDSCFKHVDLNQVPTGILLEKGLPTVNVEIFNGENNDSNVMNLHLWRRAYGTLQRAHINTDGLKIGVDANGNAQILQQENLAMWFSTNSNERMRILAGGNVGIGTSTPVAKLAVEGNVYPQTDGSYDLGTVTALSGTDYRWNNICAVNSVIQTSDRNKKKNIEELKYGISDIMKLRPVTFEWISNNNGRRIGLIAQEVQPIINEIVIGEDGKGMGMMYTELIPVLIKGMQEQQQMIAEQQQQIILLQNQIVDLYGLGNISQTKQYKDSLGIQSQTILLQEGPKLFQNIPNPFDLTTVIHYYLPKGTFNATLKIFDSSGKELVQYKLFNCGYSFVNVESVNMPSGSYTCSLIIGDKVIDTMKMIISK